MRKLNKEQTVFLKYIYKCNFLSQISINYNGHAKFLTFRSLNDNRDNLITTHDWWRLMDVQEWLQQIIKKGEYGDTSFNNDRLWLNSLRFQYMIYKKDKNENVK